MSETMPPCSGNPADREPVALRHLDELDEITREYARITDSETGGWTMLAAALWIAGAELLIRVSETWATLAYLAMAPGALALLHWERRSSSPHGAITVVPRDRWARQQMGQRMWGTIFLGSTGELMALLALYQAVTRLRWWELPATTWLASAIVFVAAVAAPVAALLLAGPRTLWSATSTALVSSLTMVASVAVGVEYKVHAGKVGIAFALTLICLLGFGAVMAIGFRRRQLRILDQRIAHLRGRLR